MKKLSAQAKSDQRGVVQPILIIGGAIVGIIIILVATGSLKFSGYIKNDNNQSRSDQPETQTAAPSPTEKPKPAVKLNSESYTDSKNGFSISYPEGWKVREQTDNVTMYKPSESKGTDQADALIGVVAGGLGESKDLKLASIADFHKTLLKKQFSNTEFISEKEIKVNGQDAYELEFTGEVRSEKMHGRYILIKGDKYLFAIVGTANSGLWDSEKDDIDASIQTFKIS